MLLNTLQECNFHIFYFILLGLIILVNIPLRMISINYIHKILNKGKFTWIIPKSIRFLVNGKFKCFDTSVAGTYYARLHLHDEDNTNCFFYYPFKNKIEYEYWDSAIDYNTRLKCGILYKTHKKGKFLLGIFYNNYFIGIYYRLGKAYININNKEIKIGYDYAHYSFKKIKKLIKKAMDV